MKQKSHIYIINGTRSKHKMIGLNIKHRSKYKTYNDGYMH